LDFIIVSIRIKPPYLKYIAPPERGAVANSVAVPLIFQNNLPELAPWKNAIAFLPVAEVSQGRSLHLSG
jgi:hypothetical protein